MIPILLNQHGVHLPFQLSKFLKCIVAVLNIMVFLYASFLQADKMNLDRGSSESQVYGGSCVRETQDFVLSVKTIDKEHGQSSSLAGPSTTHPVFIYIGPPMDFVSSRLRFRRNPQR